MVSTYSMDGRALGFMEAHGEEGITTRDGVNCGGEWKPTRREGMPPQSLPTRRRAVPAEICKGPVVVTSTSGHLAPAAVVLASSFLLSDSAARRIDDHWQSRTVRRGSRGAGVNCGGGSVAASAR